MCTNCHIFAILSATSRAMHRGKITRSYCLHKRNEKRNTTDNHQNNTAKSFKRIRIKFILLKLCTYSDKEKTVDKCSPVTCYYFLCRAHAYFSLQLHSNISSKMVLRSPPSGAFMEKSFPQTPFLHCSLLLRPLPLLPVTDHACSTTGGVKLPGLKAHAPAQTSRCWQVPRSGR